MDVGTIIGEGLGFLKEILRVLFPGTDEKVKRRRLGFEERIFDIERRLDALMAVYPRHDAAEMESLLKEKRDIEKAIIREASTSL